MLSDRFKGTDGARILAQALSTQSLVGHDRILAEALASVCELCDVAADQTLLAQGGADNDIYFILSGSFRILINGREVALRHAGLHIGEMALVDPSLRRTATVVARESSLVAKISEASFVPIADTHPRIWRAIGAELSRRLDQRARFHKRPNEHPRLFIGSSTEALPIAQALGKAVPHEVAVVTLWTQGVFGASRFPIEDLEALLESADFAVLVAAADDRVTVRGHEFDAPRDNVVFELGLFMGALRRHRTFVLMPRDAKVKLPTDLLGLTQLHYSNDIGEPSKAVAAAVDEVIGRIRAQGPR